MHDTVLAAIAYNQFDKQNEVYIAEKGVLDCQNDDVHVERKLNVLDCQYVLFGNLKRLFDDSHCKRDCKPRGIGYHWH